MRSIFVWNNSTFVCSNPIIIDEKKKQHGSICLIFLVRRRELQNWILGMKTNKRPFTIWQEKRSEANIIVTFFFLWKKYFLWRAPQKKSSLFLLRKQSQQNIWVSEERSIFVWKRQKLYFDLIPIIVNKQKTQLLKKISLL